MELHFVVKREREKERRTGGAVMGKVDKLIARGRERERGRWGEADRDVKRATTLLIAHVY